MGGYRRSDKPQKINICKSCLCRRCNTVFCQYERALHVYPQNAACIYCGMNENSVSVNSCLEFHPRVVTPQFRIKAFRKKRYARIGQIIAALQRELNNIK